MCFRLRRRCHPAGAAAGGPWLNLRPAPGRVRVAPSDPPEMRAGWTAGGCSGSPGACGKSSLCARTAPARERHPLARDDLRPELACNTQRSRTSLRGQPRERCALPDQRILDRIAAWQESGILDAPTADRLRALEANSPSEPATATELPRASASAGLSSLGLDLDLGEAFAYLGSFFLLGAWYWFINQAAVGQASADGTWAFGLAVPAVVFASLGLVLGRRTGKVGRSAGFWLLLSGIHVLFAVPFIAGLLLGASASSESGLSAYRWLFGSVAWLLAALAFRRYLASLPTQLGVLGAIATLTATGVDRVARRITGPPSFTGAGVPHGDAYAITWMGVAATGTVVATVAMGLLARVEIEAARVDPAARRRLAVTRFAGGMTLTIGAAIA